MKEAFMRMCCSLSCSSLLLFSMWSALTSLSSLEACCKGDAGTSSSVGGRRLSAGSSGATPLIAPLVCEPNGMLTRLSLRRWASTEVKKFMT